MVYVISFVVGNHCTEINFCFGIHTFSELGVVKIKLITTQVIFTFIAKFVKKFFIFVFVAKFVKKFFTFFAASFIQFNKSFFSADSAFSFKIFFCSSCNFDKYFCRCCFFNIRNLIYYFQCLSYASLNSRCNIHIFNLSVQAVIFAHIFFSKLFGFFQKLIFV